MLTIINLLQRDVSGFVSGGLSDDVRVRLSGDFSDRDGYVLNTFSGERLDDNRQYGGRLAVDANTGPVTAKVRIFYRKRAFRGPSYDPIQKDAPLPSGTFDLAPWRVNADYGYLPAKQEAWGGNLRLESEIGDGITFVSQTNYMNFKFIADGYDGDGTALDLVHPAQIPQRIERAKTFSQEFNIVGQSQAGDWVIGAYYLRDRVTQANFTATPFLAAAGINSTNSITSTKSDSYSLFGDVTYRFTEAFSLYGGLRGMIEHQEARQTAYLETPVGAAYLCTPNALAGRPKQDRAAITGRFGARYELTNDSNIYAQYSRGYKSGGFAPTQCNNPFGPEKLNAFEVGSKNRLFGRTLDVNLSAFYYDFRDLQMEQIIITSLVTANVPKSEIYGAEAELNWRPVKGAAINLGASWLHARFKQFSDVDPMNPAAGVQDLRGNALTRAPDWTLNFGAQYAFPLASGSLTARGDVYASDSFNFRQFGDQASVQRRYAQLGGSIGYRRDDDRWGVRAYIKNAVLQGVIANPPTGLLGVYGAPRTYGVEASVNF